jgi:hypothetical protein
MHRVLPPKLLCCYLLLVDEREAIRLHETLQLLLERLLILPQHNHACWSYGRQSKKRERGPVEVSALVCSQQLLIEN